MQINTNYANLCRNPLHNCSDRIHEKGKQFMSIYAISTNYANLCTNPFHTCSDWFHETSKQFMLIYGHLLQIMLIYANNINESVQQTMKPTTNSYHRYCRKVANKQIQCS